MSTACHLQIDDQVEVVNKCLETYLICFTSEKPHQWEQWLPFIEWQYNTSYNGATKMTPYEFFYRENSLSITSYLPSICKVYAMDHKLHTREAIHLQQGIKCLFNINPVRKHPSKKKHLSNQHPSYMDPMRSSNTLDKWPTNWLFYPTPRLIHFFMFFG